MIRLYLSTAILASLTGFALLTTPMGCAATPGARPTDMSAAAHRAAAEEHAAESERHSEQSAPAAGAPVSAATGGHGDHFIDAGNPTQHHQGRAHAHRKHANAHAAAAEALEQFENAQCHGLERGDRSSCPLMKDVAAVEDIPDGVRITLAETASFEEIASHVQCHIAFAQTQGREGMDSCPLYVLGVTFGSSSPGQLDLTVNDPAAAPALRARATSHLRVVAHDAAD